MGKHRSKSSKPTAKVARAESPDAPTTTTAVPTLIHDGSPGRAIQILILLLGIILPQLILIGPSLVGLKLLLPLDILADRTTYLPRASPDAPNQVPKDGTLGDLVFQTEVHRQLVIEEIHAGRIPLWNPYNYCGHPLLAANHTQVFSPYRILDYLWPSPIALAWGALFRSLVIGVGTYLLCRRSMKVGWLSAAAGGWFAPIAGPMIISSGYPGAAIISFLPWLLLAIDRCVSRPDGKAVLVLAVVTAFTLLSGHPAFAGHLLLVGGLFYVWQHAFHYGFRASVRPPALHSAMAALGGVILGFVLSAPQTLPTVEYMRSSQRIAQRGEGVIETKGIGSAAFVQMVLPYSLGSTQRGSLYIGVEGNRGGNRIESAAIGSTGLIAALLLMPVGWADRKRRRWMAFWTLLALFCAVPAIGVPGIGAIFELPPLSLLRNNRLVFVSGFAVLAMAVIGVNAIADARAFTAIWAGRIAMACGVFAALALGVWCIDKSMDIPMDEAAGSAAATNPLVTMIPDLWAPAVGDDLVGWFSLMYRNGLMLSVTTILFSIGLLFSLRSAVSRAKQTIALPALLAVLAVAEMTASAYGVNVQTDPALYYPKLGWMDQVSSTSDRMCGIDCLPANVALLNRLRDIRGYDGADPVPAVKLIERAQDPTHPPILSLPYAVTLYLSVNPRSPGPIADLLAVRHLVGRGAPPPGLKIAWAGSDYWVAENVRALPRVTLPAHVEVVADPAERLRRLSSPSADPALLSLLETETAGVTTATGTAHIVDDQAERVVIDVDLSTGGLVRLADSWDSGWRATHNGRPVDILRVDHAIRGVVVPPGKGTIEFVYAPASFRWGVWLALAASIVAGVTAVFWRTRPDRNTASPARPDHPKVAE